MNSDIYEKLFALIRVGLDLECSSPNLSVADCESILKLSDRHSITPIIYRGIQKNGGSKEILSVFDKSMNKVLVQTIRNGDALKRISNALNTSCIKYIPLKGSVLKDLYPDPLLRTSTDIDILVAEEDLNSAIETIEKNTDFVLKKQYYHDVSMFSPSVHLELHYRINENMKNLDKLLSNAWDYSVLNTDYCYKFTPEFQVFYVLSHMCFHMIKGGLGIRPLLDLWLLRNKTRFCDSEVVAMCSECGILTFYEKCCLLVDCWMEGKAVPDDLQVFESYVLTGGLFGSRENALASKQRENRFSFYFHRVFLSKNLLEIEYPILKSKPYFCPIYQIRRWFNLLNAEKLRKVKKEINSINHLDSEKITSYDDLLSSLGL